MKKHKQKNKISPVEDKKQSSLLSFFSFKRKPEDSVPEPKNSAISDDTENEPGSNLSSPDIIEGTPQSKPRSANVLTSRLNFEFSFNGCSNDVPSRKQLFPDSSGMGDQIETENSVLKLENDETKSRSKRMSDDACNDLLEEIENSPKSLIISNSKPFESSCPKKRVKLDTSRLEKKILGKSPPKSIAAEIGKRNSQCIMTRKIKPRQDANFSEKPTEPLNSKSADPKIENHEVLIDIENLGDLLYEDFNLSDKKLDLSSWKYCKVKLIEKTEFGLKTQLREFVNSKNKESLSTFCYIRGYWGESELKLNDLISIKARFDLSLNCWLVDEKAGFVVKYPNLLLTGTSIVGSLFCLRKAVLSYLFPGFDPPNMSMFLGSLVHELFQEVLKNKFYEEKEMKLVATDLLSRRRTLLDAYECNISLIDLQLELLKFVPRIVSFINMYILNKENSSRKMWAGHIREIISIEENFWLPQLGIKGKTDLIVDAKTEAGTKVMPIELKTGRPSNSVEHRGQIILYLMMMTELDMNVETGLLLYLKDNVMHEIIPRQGEMNGLVTIRNNLVDYFVKNEEPTLSSENIFSVPALPEPINHHSACSRCPYLTACSVALSEDDQKKLPINNPLRDLSISSIQHLSCTHIDYVFHWLGLLKLEESEKSNGRFATVSNIWLMNVEDRQNRGFCIPWLQIIDVEVCENYFIHSLKQSDGDCDLMSTGIVDGDYIVVSTNNRFAVVTGFVYNISKTVIKLKLDRQLDKNEKINYIVDKYSGTEGLLGFNCANLLLLLENSDGAANLRKFIIDLELPLFNSVPRSLSKECCSILSPLNEDQKSSITKVLCAKNFTLIKGLPGTGKTATIVALIRILVYLNYSVLITSHTHSAVDNVLIRLKDSIDFLRLGSSSKVHSAIKPHCEDVLMSDPSIKSTEDIEHFYNKKQVVGVTCMGCSHVLLFKRTFDFCIIDEATQVLQPSILKALYSASKFVLIGDPDQLPPVVHNFKASRLGLSESLFHRLDQPEVTTTLHLQYRMNLEIMKFANTFAYQDQLKCNNEDVNFATIQFNDSSKIIKQHEWLDGVLSSDVQNSVIFLNISDLTMPESSSLYSNQLEVDVTSVVLDAFKKSVKNAYDIGVIAPYREQVQLLKRNLSDLYADVEINTVDQFQGRDKDIIIFSSSRWSNQKEEGILGDKRRLTVAITRAKQKLIIIGNATILEECSTFSSLLSCISPENVINIEKLNNY